MESEKKKRTFSPFLRQVLVSASVSINMMSHGSVIGFSAILLPQLELNESYIKINNDSASWIASILGFALIAGNMISPILMERIGRKRTHLLSTIPITFGWFLLITSKSVTEMIIARFLQGVSMGMLAPLAGIIVGESVSPTNRGIFLGIVSLALGIGIFLGHVIGTFLSWQLTALICSSFAFTALLLIIFVPETPSWLALQGRYDDCRKSYHWFRGYEDKATKELETLIEAIKIDKDAEATDNMKNKHASKSAIRDFGVTLRKKEFYKPLILMFHLYTLFQISGTNVFSSYAIDILKALFDQDVNVYGMMLLADALRIISSVCSCILVGRFKRRKLLFTSIIFVMIGLLGMSGCLYLKIFGVLKSFPNWVPGLFLVIYIFSLPLGVLPLPIAMSGEIFPSSHRGLGGGISVLLLSTLYFIVVKSAPYMFLTMGIEGTYLCYTFVLAYISVFLYFTLPETKDRTLLEIENHFKGIETTSDELNVFLEKADLHQVPEHRMHRRVSSITC